MKPFICPTFWTDTDIEPLTAAQKLTVLWLITNQQTNILGVCEASGRRFSFETGLDPSELDATIEALPRMFQRVGNCILARKFIRHQFGTGAKLVRNTFFKKLSSELADAPAEVREVLIGDYPEFRQKPIPTPSPCHGDHAPANGDGMGQGEEEDRKGREGEQETATPPPLTPEQYDRVTKRPPPTPNLKGGIPMDELRRRIGGIKGRPPNKAWTCIEEHSLVDAMPITDDELCLVERFYLLPQNEDDPKLRARRHDVRSLVENWNGEVDKARAYFQQQPRRAPAI